MDWVLGEPIWLGCPDFADVFIGGEGLEPSAEVVSANEVGEVHFELVVVVIVEALDGRLLDGAVHSLDLTIGPGMLDTWPIVLPSMRWKTMRHQNPGSNT
jgi:hypothetical protein